MARHFKIRFQHWLIGLTSLLILGAAGGFLATVHRSFNQMGQDTAAQQFALMSALAERKLEGLIHHSGNGVKIRAGGERRAFIENDALNPSALVSTFLGSLAVEPDIYSHYFALANDDFLQVIAIRGSRQKQQALQAPQGTEFVVRRITRTPSGQRIDEYEFLDIQRARIGRRSQAAQLKPTQRPWYLGAMAQSDLFITEPYVYQSDGQLGITVAAPLENGAGVLATDISLDGLSGFLKQLQLSPNGAIAVLNDRNQVLTFDGRGAGFAGLTVAPMSAADQLTHPQLALLQGDKLSGSAQIVTLGTPARRFIVASREFKPTQNTRFYITMWAPESDFTGAFDVALRDVVGLSVLLLLVLLPFTFVGSRRIVKTLTTLATDSERLKRLDFASAPHKTSSMLYELDALSEAQFVMHVAIKTRTEQLKDSQSKLASLVNTGISLSREQDRQKLLQTILFGARDIAHCAAVTLFLKTEHNTLVFSQRTSDDALPTFEIPLFDANGTANDKFVVVNVAVRNTTVVIDDVYSETRFDLSGTKKFSEESGIKTISMLTVPLSPRAGEVIGVIQLINALDPQTQQPIPFPPELIEFVEALSAQAAVAIENQNLIAAQKELMDALIKLIAGAIDAKSPYTGGHCERVPELGVMLARAASAQNEGPLAHFKFETDDEWREFRIGAWLHDCGKVTTPEFVVDKAVKLETIYNRIHEVRMRFEVLLRDARIQTLEAIEAGTDAAQAQAAFAARKAQLMRDFEFVAECNMGGEFMAPDKIERLKTIAQETWMRHFDNRLGLSYEEAVRYPPATDTLPVQERLLADKPHHIIARTNKQILDSKWGFQVTVPEHLYNQGEVYNLSVARGTLTEEERFKINEHVMQSLMMLEQLPLPKNLRKVPGYAGTHHETLLGTGYPRKLAAAALTVPMRIMAIADIFEALTASDRPYKKAKKLSESIKILSFFKKDQHIDPDIFDLFLTSGVYKQYAEKYLQPDQIDEVDIAQYLVVKDASSD